MDKINKNPGELKNLCKKYKVKSLFVFGSKQMEIQIVI